MLNQVFISYRHESSEHSRAVRRLGEMLRQAGLPVVLDQFYLEDYPGGPDEGWPQWCQKCANESACVLIVASKGWFAAYNDEEPPGEGLGAATEADLFLQDIWNQKGHNERIRLVFLNSFAAETVPLALQRWQQFRPFDAPGPAGMIRWAAVRLNTKIPETSNVRWPDPIHFQPGIADRNKNEWPAVLDLLAGKSSQRILLFEGGSGVGKSELVRQSVAYAKQLGMPVAHIDFKSGTLKTEDVLGLIDLEVGSHLPNFFRQEPKKIYTFKKDLRALRNPILFIFDSYEDAVGNHNLAEWLNVQLLGDLENTPAIAVIIAGQKVPDSTHTSWRNLVRDFHLLPITESAPWKEWALHRYPNVCESDLNTLLRLAGGQPSLMVVYCETIAKAGVS